MIGVSRRTRQIAGGITGLVLGLAIAWLVLFAAYVIFAVYFWPD